jgi:hypothetical protein
MTGSCPAVGRRLINDGAQPRAADWWRQANWDEARRRRGEPRPAPTSANGAQVRRDAAVSRGPWCRRAGPRWRHYCRAGWVVGTATPANGYEPSEGTPRSRLATAAVSPTSGNTLSAMKAGPSRSVTTARPGTMRSGRTQMLCRRASVDSFGISIDKPLVPERTGFFARAHVVMHRTNTANERCRRGCRIR